MSGYANFLTGRKGNFLKDKISTGSWSPDGKLYTTDDGHEWTYGSAGDGMLYTNINGKNTSWNEYYGDMTKLPTATKPTPTLPILKDIVPEVPSAEEVPGGGEDIVSEVPSAGEVPGGGGDSGSNAVPVIPGVQPSVPTYEQYLAGDGKEVNDAYGQVIKNARQEYALNRATYGARGEQLGRAGLTGSGYGDYLEGAAYSAMQGAISQAELGRAKSYAEYLTQHQQNAASFAEYLTQKQDEEAQARSNYLSNTLVGLAMNNSALTAADIMQYARDIGGYEISQAEAEKVLSDAALQRKVSGADAAFIDNLAYGVAYDGDGNLLTMKTEEEYRRSLAYWELSEEEMQSVLNKIQQHYGMTFEEGAAKNAEAAAEQRDELIKGFVSSVCSSVGRGGSITEEELAVLLEYNDILNPTDEELAKIKGDLSAFGVSVQSQAEVDAANAAALEAENAAAQNEINTDVNTYVLSKYADCNDAGNLRFNLEKEGYNEAAIDAAIGTYFELHANDISNAIDGAASVGDLMSAYSLEQIQGMADKTISKEQVSTIQAQVAARIEELLNQAYESGDASEVAALLGVTFDAGTTNFGGEIAKAAYDAYAIGILHPAQLGGLFDRFVEDSLADLGSESGVAVELAQIAGEITDIIGDDEDLTAMYDGYMDRLAEIVKIGLDGRVYINGKASEAKIEGNPPSNHAETMPSSGVLPRDAAEGDVYVHYGKIYQYIGIDDGMGNTRCIWSKAEVKIPKGSSNLKNYITMLILRNRENGLIDYENTYHPIIQNSEAIMSVKNKYQGKGTSSSYSAYLTGGK